MSEQEPPRQTPGEFDPGQPQYSQPQYGQPPSSQPGDGQPQYPQPQYPQPQYAQSQYPQSQYPQPQYPQPQYGQPPSGQPPYGQPQYAQPPYGQPPSGQPPYGQPQFGGAYPPPPKRRKRKILTILGVLLALLVAAVVLSVVAFNKTGEPAGPKRTLAIPAASGNYTELTGPSFDSIASAIQSQFGSSGQTFKNAEIGVFSVTGQATPAVVLLGLSAAGNPSFARELRLRSAQAEAKEVFKGAHATGITEHPAGPLGGIIECASLQTVTGEPPLCLWLDQSTLGMLIAIGGQTTATLAADTLQMRSDTER